MVNFSLFTILSLIFLSQDRAFAKPEAGSTFCEVYPDSPHCLAGKVECNFCHAGPPVLNSYGMDIQKVFAGGDFLDIAVFSIKLKEVEKLDSDGDSNLNIDELDQGTLPGDQESAIDDKAMTYSYQDDLAFKKVKTIYCGDSVSYDEMQTFAASADKKQFIHNTLDKCLESDYWKNEALHRLADEKIMPIEAVGSMTAAVKIGEYDWDYRLYAYIMTGNRDVRELLTADYHVDTNENIVNGTIARSEPFQLGERIVIAGGQPLQTNRRVGMLTTQWFLSVNTMFARLPMNTAAQAYRAYLGQDIAKGEGLFPITDEPRDVDNKNTAQPACAVCHSTLDPLAYPFSTYKGIEIGIGLLFNSIGTYDAGRTPWEGQGSLIGQPVNDLLEWAEVAKETDDFKKKIALDLYTQALSQGPITQSEQEEFRVCWQSLPDNGYSANALIHCIVDTMGFGGRPDL
ncbi:MAG: hypothetical protein AB8G05_16685 [Oligoflexales bacterium]